MLSIALVGSLFVVVLAGLAIGAFAVRRRQNTLSATREAAQLQRRADHLFKIALAAQVHTSSSDIARALLDEALRVLEYAAQLAPATESIGNLRRECQELIATIEPLPAAQQTRDAFLDFPESELIEAQLHLTEASRLLIGLEKRGIIDYDALAEMNVALKQAQRGIDLRLQLLKAAHALDGDRNSPKHDEVRASDYFAAAEQNRAQSSH
jgi:hypothetical protein